MATIVKELSGYLDIFSAFEGRAAGSQLLWLKNLRRDAFARFYEIGFPTTRLEDWRFTNVAAISRSRFQLAARGLRGVTSKDVAQWRIEGSGSELVFINGHFAPELSRILDSNRVRVTGLSEALTTDSAAVEKNLGRYLDQQRDSFSALNTAFAEDGAFIHIPRGVVVQDPIHVVFVSIGASAAEMHHPRNLIVAEEGSQVAIVEDYVSLGAGTTFCNTATELVAGDGTNISHYSIEREDSSALNISTLRIQQGRDANVASHALLLGGALVRNNVHPVLAGEGGECLINGLFLGSGRQHLDNYMLVEHAAPHCESRQFYNGILGQQSHGVFHGRIVVHKAGQKTDAKQTNRNLLLSDDAQIDTKPQLEIHADDVKCTHGATIGRVEDEALFYLRSRGISDAEARNMMLVAFAGECLDRMNEAPLREYLQALVREHVQRIA